MITHCAPTHSQSATDFHSLTHSLCVISFIIQQSFHFPFWTDGWMDTLSLTHSQSLTHSHSQSVTHSLTVSQSFCVAVREASAVTVTVTRHASKQVGVAWCAGWPGWAVFFSLCRAVLCRSFAGVGGNERIDEHSFVRSFAVRLRCVALRCVVDTTD